MKKQPDKGKITALYERLSHDDERAGESVSIENQKRILEDYAQKNGFTNIRHFTDDGVRGTTFKRPGLDAMLEEIRAGNVATVIIKDQSRIGRDVVEVGLLKRTFDEYHVRFIAANDNLDTANGFDIMSIFRDVINEWYVADTSRKIKTVFKSRMEKGLRCSGSVSYGYLASKENKGEWVIDEEAAAVVRRIFHSVVAGESIASIARALRAEKIPIPSEHWKRIGAPVRAAKYTDPYAWSTTTISYILKRPEYTGRKVLGKTVCENYKTKSTRKTAPEEQYIFDGEIPAIVDEETWNTVQRLMGTKRRAPKRQTTPNRLTGLLYCADCGAKLTHRSSLVQGKYLDDAFVCSSYRQLTRDCTMHYIPTAKIEAAILAAIQRVSWYVRHNEAEFIERVREATDQHQENAVKEYRQKVSKAQRRCKELDGLVKKLYEGNATGKIPDKHFTRLLAEYDEEQTGLEAAITQWQEAIESWNADRLKTDMQYNNLILTVVREEGGCYMKKLPQISDAEFEVMDVIWKYAPISTNEITDRLAKVKEWSPKTIYTMLSRLEKKGVIVHEKESRVFVYTPCVRKEDYIEAESRTLANRFFDGAMSQMVVNFLDQRDLSSEDLDELQCILDKKRKK